MLAKYELRELNEIWTLQTDHFLAPGNSYFALDQGIYFTLETCLLVKRDQQNSLRKKVYSFRNLVKNFMQVKISDTITVQPKEERQNVLMETRMI